MKTRPGWAWLYFGGAMLVLGIIIWATACSHPKALQDLPNEKLETNIGERLVYINPDKFPNVVAFCDGPTRVYITTRDYQDPVVVPNHPWCTGGEPGG